LIGSFSYHHKGPCHIYQKETATQKKQSVKKIEELDKVLEQQRHDEWELDNPMRRLRLTTVPGPKPKWTWNVANGKLQRSKKGGVDWWRYYSEIQIPKLFPFCKRIGGVVIEDGAGCHIHHFVQAQYKQHGVERVTWPGNSPDLNAIEAVWPVLKRQTTLKGAHETRSSAEKEWKRKWEEIPQAKLQAFIDRIREHIPKIIACGGGNEYEEGLHSRAKARREKAQQKAALLEAREHLELAGEWVTVFE
jgi:hypothetical protein